MDYFYETGMMVLQGTGVATGVIVVVLSLWKICLNKKLDREYGKKKG